MELKRRAWRWDAGRTWAIVLIGVGCLPVGLFLVAFPLGDTDRLGALSLVVVGLVASLSLIAYLDRKIDRREERRFPFE